MSRRLPLAAAAVALLGGAAAAPASAAADVYDVTFDVTIELRGEQRLDSANFGLLVDRTEASAAVRGRVPGVRVEGGRLADGPLGLPPAGPTAQASAAAGRFEASTDGVVGRTCPVSGARAVGSPRLSAAHDPAVVRFSPLAAIRVETTCPDTGAGATSWSGVDRDGPRWLAGPVTARIAPPAPGEARAVRAVEATARLATCDRDGESAAGASCSATLRGTVTFTRTGEGGRGAGAPAPRWPRPRAASASGPVDRRDNLFVYRAVRVDVDARLRVRSEHRPAGEPARWSALDMAASLHRAIRSPDVERHGGWHATRGQLDGSLGAVATDGARLTWRGSAAYDRGVTARHTSSGREWVDASRECRELRWRARGAVGGVLRRGPRGRVVVLVRLPGIGARPSACGAASFAEDPIRWDLTARGTLPAASLLRPRLVVPFAARHVRSAGSQRRELRVAGSLTLVREDACRNPPEYPCAARFWDG